MQQMEELAAGECGGGDRHGQKIVAVVASEYFELQLSEGNLAFKNIELAASKMYARGVIVMIYFDGTIYTTLATGKGTSRCWTLHFLI